MARSRLWELLWSEEPHTRLEPPGRGLVPGELRQTANGRSAGVGWSGRVVYAVDNGGRVVLVEAWVAAERLEPAAR